MQSGAAACRTLCNPDNEVSAHYLIDRDGTLRSLVAEDMRAWHAGAGCWHDITDVNSHSIGIELDNDGYSPFSAPLMDTLTTLLPQIMQRWGIPARGVIGHSDMAPGRKIDPGARFDWQRLARLGLCRMPEPQTADVDETRFVADMQRAGFTATDDPSLLLHAFRLRFAPQRIGPLCPQDMGEVASLLDAPTPNT